MGYSSVVEQRSVKPFVGGSNPPIPANSRYKHDKHF